jgi:molybdopterin-guanine dinucleotide biosynthesis protein A
VLAGGAGKRIGGDKGIVELAGRPLLLYPIDVLRQVCEHVVVVAKQDTKLPQLAGEAEVWIEPDEPQHPLAGIVHALRTATARKLLVLACDMPLVPVELLRALLKAADGPGAIARCGGIGEPLCACYTRGALKGLERFDPSERAIDVVERLGVAHVDWDDANAVLSVNAPEDVIRAQALLSPAPGARPRQ